MIEVRDLRKRFGAVEALKGISFSARRGEVYGLLGPNGAGKTTALRILATLLKADGGSARLGGLDVSKDAEGVRRSIGVVNGGMGLYDRLSGREILHYFGKLYGLRPARVEARIDELDAMLKLGEILPRRAGGFSTGMKQKIVIARAVLHDPPVIFFDEATSGLDVMARRAVLDFVRAYPGEARTALYSTHVMSEVEEVCDRAAIIFEGSLIAEGSIAELLERGGTTSLERAFFKIVEERGAAPQGVTA